VIGDAKHRHVVQAEEVVLGAASRAGRLHVVDLGTRIPEIADKTSEVRVLLVRAAELLDDFPVVETEPREVLDKLNV
jgi:hypothetical protein